LLNILSTTANALRARAKDTGSIETPRADPRWGLVLSS
jgi:hypothetical protein